MTRVIVFWKSMSWSLYFGNYHTLSYVTVVVSISFSIIPI